MKTLIILPLFVLGTTSLFAQTNTKRTNKELKETIIKTDTKVLIVKEIEVEKKKKKATAAPPKVAILNKKQK